MVDENVAGEWASQVAWPKRVVVTAGMPYGNKGLHFGHVGGVFVPADAYARFLRDRIGADNVRFVSGTDCFGSPIDEGYRKLVEEQGFVGSIADYVQGNHDAQKATLDAYSISLYIYEGSGIGHSGEVHEDFTARFIRRLHENGHLSTLQTRQFYDVEADTFLNGRQVQGYCPVQGCKGERGYADECDMGHQYDPADLIKPTSTITGTTPEMRLVENWYFDLPGFASYLRDYVEALRHDGDVRPVVPETISEFLGDPVIFVKNDAYDTYRELADSLPSHVYAEAEKGKQSFELRFSDIYDRDAARDVLSASGVRFRTGKALVPFRISGNIEWGVPVPEMDGISGLTVWCWPESLWAPISFTIAANDARGLAHDSWRDFWCSDDARVYQFIGQDNIYFYGIAQPALWAATQEGNACALKPTGSDLRHTTLVANHHMLLGDKKASSSSAVKPPSADELLDFYTPEQLRAHWLALGLDQRSVGFKPKAFEPDESKRSDPRVADPVLKEGALLTRVFNRLARSCLYEAKNTFDCAIPLDVPTSEALERAHDALRRYEAFMEHVELHSVMSLMDEFIRFSNQHWSAGIKEAEDLQDTEMRRQVLADSCFLLRVCTLLMHPVVPVGCEKICASLQFAPEVFFSWDASFAGIAELCGPEERESGFHAVEELPPRTDFFEAHPSQLK